MWRGQLRIANKMLHPKLIELEKSFNTSVLTQIFDPLLVEKKVELWIKRDDLIHPVISGNKWRKLKFILNQALIEDSHTIISMGGAYSNHLHALAYAGKQLNMSTVGYIRGEMPKRWSSTLLDLEKWGMELRFVSRSDYRQLRQYKKSNELPGIKEGEYWLPEGGAHSLALTGVSEIITEIDMDYDAVCVPCGTGTTLAGLAEASMERCKVFGFSALKGGDFLQNDVEMMLSKNKFNGTIYLDYHFGGFAKTNNELLLFIQQFFLQHAIELDHVYTGKMFYALFELISKNQFKAGQRLIAIHTGGLQGKRE